MKKTLSSAKSAVPVSVQTGIAAKEDHSVTFKVKVLPRSSSNSIEGMENGEWEVKLTAPPVEGAANTALIHYLSDVLDVPRRFVTIIGGQSSRSKLVRVDGLTEEQVKQKLGVE
jgi:uncharacterized protein